MREGLGSHWLDSWAYYRDRSVRRYRRRVDVLAFHGPITMHADTLATAYISYLTQKNGVNP